MIWEPTPEFIAQTNVYRLMQRLGITTREDFLRYSVEHLEAFWAALVEEVGIRWVEPYKQILDTSNGPEWSRWFTGGKLNIADNCIDRHRSVTHPAILWEGEDQTTREISFPQLYAQTNRLANALRS